MTDLSRLLDSLTTFVRRYVVLTDAELTAVALWIFHTHTFEAAESTPYLSVTSAEKRSGKTRLLEVLELLVRQPLPTSNISDAALFRAIAKLEPTLLFDEIDSVFGPKARDREDLRGMLNAGYRRGAVALRMGGSKMTTLENFPVFAAKAFAGIGDCLPDTIADRSIRLRLERRTREETIERFRRRDAAEAAGVLHQWAAELAEVHLPTLTNARPQLPDELDDRAQDVWEPLLAIADLAGTEWQERSRACAIQLSSGEAHEDESLGVRLLTDIRDVFHATDERRYRTADLITELAKIEDSSWGDWYGKPISAHGLSRLLKPYRIRVMPVWVDGAKANGYKIEQFENAWLRVLGSRDGRAGRTESNETKAPTAPTAPTTDSATEPTWTEWEDALQRLQEREGVRMFTFDEVHAEIERMQDELIDADPASDDQPPLDDDEADAIHQSLLADESEAA